MKNSTLRTSAQILFLIFLGLLVRLPLLTGSFWLDEAAQALESTRPLAQQLQIAQDFQPPLLHLITHFAARFSHAEWWLRTIGALIPGLITLFFTYKIGQILFSRTTALIATLLLVTSSFHIFYSQELRPYSLATAFAIWSWYILVHAFFSDKKFSWRTFFLYSLVTTLGLYSTYLYPFVILSQIMYVVCLERAFFKSFITSLGISGALFAPWLPSFWEQLQVGQQLRTQLPGWEAVVAIPQLKSLPLVIGKFLFGVLNLEINFLFIGISTVLTLAIGLTAVSKNKAYFLSKQMIVVYCWFIIPLLTAWLVSFFIPILQPKRVLYILPAFYLLIATVCTEHKNLKTKLNIAILGLIFSINIFSTFSYYVNPLYQRENWRAVYQKITKEYPKNTAVIFAFSDAFAPWDWYDNQNYPVFTTGSLTTSDTTAVEERLKKATEYPYLLVFDYLRDLTDPDKKIEPILEGFGFTQRDIIIVPNIGFIRVYARDEAVLSGKIISGNSQHLLL